jgi:transposase
MAECNARLVAGHAGHPYVPLLSTVPGIGKVLAFTIASEIGDISRFPSAKHLAGYSGHCVDTRPARQRGCQRDL